MTLGMCLQRLGGGTAVGGHKGSNESHDLARWEQLWEISGRIRKEIERSADWKSRPRDWVHGEVRRQRAWLRGHLTDGIGSGNKTDVGCP